MEKFQTITGIAAPVADANVDTDRIIPARFLKTIERSGLGKHLFNDVRYGADGAERPEFVLNREPYRKAEILVVGENFGCGSSREHAPWALKDFGIRCVIGTSFADIFFNNSFKNGMLLIRLPKEQVEQLMDDASGGHNARITVDLESQTITRPNGETIAFEVDPFKKHCLLNGLDDIGLTMQARESIAGFEERDRLSKPWLYAGTAGAAA
jgi:3-isopropylmalate/(R)-2-methylmalate dehydratase small subunit